MTNTEKLQKMYDESDYVVFFGGAGVSTESGIPDFRSADGLYNMHYSVPPEVILSQLFYFCHVMCIDSLLCLVSEAFFFKKRCHDCITFCLPDKAAPASVIFLFVLHIFICP